MSNSVWPHRRQPTRLPRPWDSPGKNTGVGCHFLLQCMKVKSGSEVTQSCPTLSDPMDCSPPGSSVHGIFQARVLEWGAIAFSVCSILIRCYIAYSLEWHLLSDPALPQLVEDLQWSETRSFLHLAQDKSSQMLLRWPILFLQHFEAFALYGR